MRRRNSWIVALGFVLLVSLAALPPAVAQTPALTWSGSIDTTWSLSNGNFNWNLNGNPATPSAYVDPNAALTFDDTANPANTNIVIDAGTTVQPYSLTFNNNLLAYSFSGGAIGGAATSLAVSGGGLVIFDNANTYGGGTTITSGTLQLGNGAVSGSVSGSVSIGVAGVLAFDNAAAQTFGGLISGGGSLLQSGPSTLVLSNLANSYSGGTTVTGGTLQFAGYGALGAAGSLTLNGGALSVTAATTLSRGIVLGTAGGTINVPFIDTQNPDNNPATTVRLTGAITGAGGLTVTGGSGSNYGGPINNLAPYVLVINGLTNSYSGNTTINNALVCPDSADNPPVNILPTGTVLTLANSGVFALQISGAAQTLAGLQGDSTTAIGTMNGNATSTVTYTINPAAGQSYTFAGTISDVEFNGRGNATGNASVINVVIGGQGTEVFSGANPYNGTTIINSGTLGLTGSLTATAITVSGGTLNEGASGVVGGAASLYVSNSGLAVLAGANTYGGATTVSGGTLGLTGSLGATAISVSGGTFNEGASGGVGGAASLNLSSGLAVLAGANAYSGATTISGGTMQVGNVNALPNTVVTDNVPSGGLAFAAGLGTATIGGLSGSGNIALLDLSGGSLTLNVNGANNTTTYSGAPERRRRHEGRQRCADAHQFAEQL